MHTDEIEEAPNKRNTLTSLMDDVFVEILCHLPIRSMFCYKCVFRSWKRLILDNHKLMPQTVVGFFYNGIYDQRNFTSITSVYPSLSFLPFTMNNIAVSDCCNGLILCWCLGADGYRYVVYNPTTQKLKVLPPRIHFVSEARLGFDLTASLHFHVFEYMEKDGQCAGVDIYSSKTTAWIFKESKWGEEAELTFSKLATVFLNGCLHYIGFCEGY
jgi:hypothetical protein